LWIDQESHLLHGVLNQLSAMGLERRFSLIPAWSKHEAARYIESYKFYERANADLIRGRVAPDFPTRLASALTQIKAVNKTDVRTLNNQIGSLADIANATLEELLVCKGLGATKAKRLHAAMRRPLDWRHDDDSDGDNSVIDCSSSNINNSSSNNNNNSSSNNNSCFG
jgi:ERCC4-type nuclease